MDEITQIINRVGTPCPKCKTKNDPYSHVDTPPIALQMDDNANNRERKWLAIRHCCKKCYAVYDLVLINEISE